MGLLDDLAREAAEAQEAQARDSDEAKRRAERAGRRLNARLRATYAYFAKFKAHLESLQPKVTTSYELRGLGTLDGLGHQEYALFADEIPELMTRFTFRCVYGGSAPLEAPVKSGPAVESFKAFLDNHRLKYKLATPTGRPAVFTIEPMVPVSFDFVSEPESERIRIDFRNVNGISVETHRFDPDRIDRAFVDEIAKEVIGKPNNLDELLGNKLTNTARVRFKQAVQASRRPRESVEKAPASVRGRNFGLGRLIGRRAAG